MLLQLLHLSLLQARGFRLLQRDDLAQCRVLVADSASGAVPADLAVPNKAAAEYHMPRFSPVSSSSCSRRCACVFWLKMVGWRGAGVGAMRSAAFSCPPGHSCALSSLT